MLPLEHPDRIHVAFDNHRLVANAGLLLPATLALRLGLGALVNQHLNLGNAPGRANTDDKLLTLLASALAGGDCIDDADALRSGDAGMYLQPLQLHKTEDFQESARAFVEKRKPEYGAR